MLWALILVAGVALTLGLLAATMLGVVPMPLALVLAAPALVVGRIAWRRSGGRHVGRGPGDGRRSRTYHQGGE